MQPGRTAKLATRIYQILSDSLRIAIVTPVFNDWPSCARLIGELDAVGGELDGVTLDVLIVNDGSSDSMGSDLLDTAGYSNISRTI